jgi:hypothetical protein
VQRAEHALDGRLQAARQGVVLQPEALCGGGRGGMVVSGPVSENTQCDVCVLRPLLMHRVNLSVSSAAMDTRVFTAHATVPACELGASPARRSTAHRPVTNEQLCIQHRVILGASSAAFDNRLLTIHVTEPVCHRGGCFQRLLLSSLSFIIHKQPHLPAEARHIVQVLGVLLQVLQDHGVEPLGLLLLRSQWRAPWSEMIGYCLGASHLTSYARSWLRSATIARLQVVM